MFISKSRVHVTPRRTFLFRSANKLEMCHGLFPELQHIDQALQVTWICICQDIPQQLLRNCILKGLCTGKEAHLHPFLIASPDWQLLLAKAASPMPHGLEGNWHKAAWDEAEFVPRGQRAPEELLVDPEQ